jgi:serine/threonine protein kinase
LEEMKMSRYCTHCKKNIELTEDRCPDCGAQLNNADHAGRYYLSEPQQGPGLSVNLEPDQKLLNGRYTIKSFLGKGSLSTVYLADDSVRSEEVVLKVVTLVSNDLADRLKREVEKHYKVVDYSHVIRLYDIHLTPYDGVVLLVVSAEYADGGAFSRWLSKNKDNICNRQTKGLYYFKEACRGVAALHDADIKNLDLEPENLLFVNEVLKVSDLSLPGLMRKVRNDEHSHQWSIMQSSTAEPRYMAPEDFMAARSGEDNSLSTDIYKLGLILFEVFDPRTRPPFEGTYQQLRQRHLHVPAPVLENADTNVARVVARCLRKNPADRFKTIRELIDALEAGLDTETPQTSQAGGLQSDEPAQQLWDKACQFMDEGNLNEAGKLCNRILSIFGEYSQARAMREEIDSRFERAKQFYETIKRGIGNQPHARLLTLLDEAVQLYPDYPDGHLVQTQLLSATAEYKNAMNKAKQQIETAREEIDDAIRRQDWNKATSLARDLDRYVESVREMVNRQSN